MLTRHVLTAARPARAQTLISLMYASRAKKIRNRSIINTDKMGDSSIHQGEPHSKLSSYSFDLSGHGRLPPQPGVIGDRESQEAAPRANTRVREPV